MTDVDKIIVEIQNLKMERDVALHEKNQLEAKLWKVKEELRKEKKETTKWKDFYLQSIK